MIKRLVFFSILTLSGLSAVDCTHPTDNTGSAVGGAGGVNSNQGGTSNGGTTSSCSTGQTDCSGVCVDLGTNSAYCGSCSTKCSTGQSCVAGACKCATGSDSCGGTACLDLQTDATHCGSCTTACTTGQTCSSGSCSCGTSGQTACSGTCTDTRTDEANCGTCGTKCSTGQSCTAGQCSCQTGLTSCGGSCVDFQSDAAHCGSCTTACSGATPVCSQGTCKGSCATGETNCNGSCVNTATNAQYCGSCTTACAAGQTCSSSACVCSGTGEQACSGVCVNTNTDANNCGTCSNKCAAGKTCVSGTCSCPSGQTDCSGTCVDTKTSAANCGACGNACSAGQSCSNGTCSCPTAGQTFCNGACTDLQTDVSNCGSCANKCTTGASCTSGACVGGQTSCPDATYNDKYTPGYDGSFHTQAVNSLPTAVADKIAQMQGTPVGAPQWTDIFRSADTSTIKGFAFRDGPRGVNLDAPLASGTSGGKSTVFPVSMARGASFDLDLEYRIGQAIGDEALAASQTMILAPTVNILRHPLWGRAQETYGEDVFLLGRMGSASTAGIQTYIGACAKHYAANNIENGRATANAQMDEQTLREIYARHFEMIIKDGGVACVMAAYNLVNGTNCTQNSHLLNDLLRTDFGFKGFTMSDWWAMPGGSGASTSSTSTKQQRAAEAVKAGLDMELPWNMYFSTLQGIINDNAGATGTFVTTAQINASATRIIEQKLRFLRSGGNLQNGPFGLTAPTSTYTSPNINQNQTHIDLAYEAALKSMVLLKNDNSTLPIDRSKVKKLAVIGATVPFTVSQGSASTITNGQVNFVSDLRTGDVGSSRANPTAGTIAPLAGITSAAGSGISVISGSSASAVTSDTDFVVVMAGLTAQDEGEEYTGAGDRKTCNLDDKQSAGTQNALIAAVAALGKPMVVVLEGGSVINVEPWISSVPALVMAWYPGMVGGKALGNLLFASSTGVTDSQGTVPANFSGKLPISWPKDCVADLPTFSGGATTTMDYYLGYRYFDHVGTTPRYAFGSGLSYTTYKYLSIQTPCSDVTKNGIIELDVSVQNTGTVDGIETVLVFAKYPGSTAPRRSVKELKGFARVNLPAGATKQVKIQIRAADLKYWNSNSGAWTVDSGNVEFDVGPSADNLPLTVTVPIK